jgi:hypothetical protein
MRCKAARQGERVMPFWSLSLTTVSLLAIITESVVPCSACGYSSVALSQVQQSGQSASNDKKKREQVIAKLVTTMKTAKDRKARWRALKELVGYGEEARPQLPAIAEMIRNECTTHINDAELTASEFAHFGGTGVWVLRDWIGASPGEKDLRYWAVLSLDYMMRHERIPPEASQAVPALLKITGDNELGIGQRALFVLEQMGSAAKAALPALLDPMLIQHHELVDLRGQPEVF